MDSKELVRRATERLNGTSKPLMPPEETLKAIVALGGEKSALEELAKTEREKSESLAEKVSGLERELAQTKSLLDKEQERLKDAEWRARELGKFVSEVACNFYEGKEREAARRVYDLNAGSIRRVRLNCYDYDSLEAATEACKKDFEKRGVPFDKALVLPWLFEYAPKGE